MLEVVASDLTDQVGVGIDRRLPACQSAVVATAESIGQISVAARGAVGTGGNQRGIGHGDSQGRGRAGAICRRRREDVAARVAVEIKALRVGRVEVRGQARRQLIETGADARNFLVANLDQSG